MKGKREYTIFIGGIIVGLAFGYGFFSGGKAVAPTVDPANGTVAQASTSTSSGDGDIGLNGTLGSPITNVKLSVGDQPAGSVVQLNSFTTPYEAWVAIREVNADGQPGNILGAHLFPIGTTASGTVTLLRDTIPNQTYYAVVYKDNGDHKFEFQNGDILMKNRDGSLLGSKFNTYPTSPH